MKSLVACGLSDKGHSRAENEDCILIGGLIERDSAISIRMASGSFHYRTYGLLAAVADGIGGHKGGAFASRFVLEQLSRIQLPDLTSTSAEQLGDLVATSIQSIHSRLMRIAELNPGLSNAGTTIAGVLLSPNAHLVFHAGDSGVYRYRDRVLFPVTADHSLEYAMKNEGGKASGSRLITNSVGGGVGLQCNIEVEAGLSFVIGDTLLLCTDGLSTVVTEGDIKQILGRSEEVHSKVVHLRDAALKAEAPDNVSVVLIQWEEDSHDG